jgi:UDP-glucose 4-epimerase
MSILVTGSAGHLGEALVRTLRAAGRAVVGLDLRASAFTDRVGSIADAGFVRESMHGIDAVLHTATLHKPHLVTHSRRQFIDSNVLGTLNLLDAAVDHGVQAFVFTSTTSSFGDAMHPAAGAPAVWVDEALAPIPKNIYGASKLAAEDLCRITQREHGLPCIVLRTSRFFPEADDHAATRERFEDSNVKTNEFLHRRVDLEDVVSAHLCALEAAARIGFGRYIVSATTPFTRDDCAELRRDPAAVLARRVPQYAAVYAARGWSLPAAFDRVYDNARARNELGWQPRIDFAAVLATLAAGGDLRGALAAEIGVKGYHGDDYADGLYPVAPPRGR